MPLYQGSSSTPHQTTHQSGGTDALAGNIDATARTVVRKNGTTIGTRRGLNIIDGANVTTAVSDDSANDAINLTISASTVAGSDQITSNTQSGTSYTLVLSDASKALELTSASNVTVTIPPNASVAFPVGTILELYRHGTGEVTVAPGAGVTIRSPSAALGLANQYSSASLRQRAANEWVLAGDLKTATAGATGSADFLAINGQVNDNSVGNFTFTTTRQINAGEQVCVAVGGNGGATNPSSITVGALSLALDKAGAQVSTNITLWSARATATITSGSTVTVTGINGTTHDAFCFSLSGVATSSPVDVTASNNFVSSSTPTSGTTAATALTGSIAIGFARWNNTNTATPGAGYTEIAETTNGTSSWSNQIEYQKLSSTGTQTATWTLSSGATGDTLIVVYKPA